jgi:glycosyltransferase involved in cell wall biosynthesis
VSAILGAYLSGELLFPLYPAAFRSFGEIDAAVVIASSSGWAHMARVRPDALHVVYCHSPARWLYSGEHLDGDGRRSIRGGIVRTVGLPFRLLDRAASRRPDLYIANSHNVKRRIHDLYGIDAHVIHPPVDIERFRPTPRGERLLVVSRLLPYKHVDLAVRVATRLGIGLDVVGDGPLLPALRELAWPDHQPSRCRRRRDRCPIDGVMPRRLRPRGGGFRHRLRRSSGRWQACHRLWSRRLA